MEINISYPKTEENPNGIPLPKQALFHASNKKYKLFAGGFGTGKSLSLCIETLKQMLVYPKNYGVLARKDLQELKATTLKDFFDICPEEVIMHHNKQDKVITFRGGSQLYYMNLDAARQAERKIKSLNLGLVAIDQLEELSYNIFLAFMGRLRRRGTARAFLATCNPAGHDWVWKTWLECPFNIFVQLLGITQEEAENICIEIEKRVNYTLLHSTNSKKRELEIYSGFGMEAGTAKTLYEKYHYYLVEATTFDNPYLPPDYLDQLLKYPENWVKRYVYCSWDDFEGLVYKEFMEKRNKIPVYEPTSGESIYIAMDYGYRNPTSIGFYAVDFDGIVRRYKELYQTGLQISEIATFIKSQSEFKTARLIADPSIWNVQRDGISVGLEFLSHGISFERADNSVAQGIDKVNEYLKTGRLLITENCISFLSEIGNYKWKAVKPGLPRNEYEEPVKKDDHAMDEVRYLINLIYAPSNNSNALPLVKPQGTDEARHQINNKIINTYGSDNLYASYD